MICKSYFLVISILLLTVNLHALIPQELGLELTPLMKSSDGEAADQFSVKYLEQMNQYFEYKFNEKSQLIVNDQISIADEIQFKKTNDKEVTIDFNRLNLQNLEIRLYGKTKLATEVVNIFKLQEKKNNQYVFELPQEYAVICLALKNRFTSLNICRDQKLLGNETRENTGLALLVNNLPAEKSGIVLLQNYEKQIFFSVQYGELELIEYSMIKRLPLVHRIEKKSDSEKVSLDFIDLFVENSEWHDDVDLNQSFVLLQLNALIPIRQEISFSKQVQKSSALSDFFVPTEKLSTQDTNIVETNESSRHRRLAIGIGSALYARTDQVFDMNLIAKNALSFKFIYEQLLESMNTIEYTIDYTQFKIVDNAESVPVAGSTGASYFLKIGHHWKLGKNLEASAGAGIFNASFYKSTNQFDSIESSASQLLSIPLSATAFFNLRPSTELRFPVEYNYLMGGEQLSSGSMIVFGVELLEDFRGSIYLLGFKSSSKNQKYYEFDQKEDHFQIYSGFLF